MELLLIVFITIMLTINIMITFVMIKIDSTVGPNIGLM